MVHRIRKVVEASNLAEARLGVDVGEDLTVLALRLSYTSPALAQLLPALFQLSRTEGPNTACPLGRTLFESQKWAGISSGRGKLRKAEKI